MILEILAALSREEGSYKDNVQVIVQNMGTMYKKSTKGSVERRTLRAALTKASRSAVTTLVPDFDPHGVLWSKGRRDLLYLEQGLSLPPLNKSLKRTDDETITGLLDFLFDDKNTTATSWSTKYVSVDGVKHSVPGLRAKVSTSEMWQRYMEHCTATGLKGTGRSVFYNVVKAVLLSPQKRSTAVDYLYGDMFGEILPTCENIVKTYLPIADHGPLLEQLMRMNVFLKRDYAKHHAGRKDKCASHDPAFALAGLKADLPQGSSPEDWLPVCGECNSVPLFFDDLLSRLQKTVALKYYHRLERGLILLAHRTERYMRHLMRVKNQSDYLTARLANIAEDEAIVILDFKMKFEPIFYQQRTLQHFGKRGISWHGAAVYYRRHHNDGSVDDTPTIVYIDHILDNISTQSGLVVAALTEAIVHVIEHTLASVKQILLQSDNAKCYQNNTLPIFLANLDDRQSQRQGAPRITGFVHTETQDGKGVIDAHFATAMRHILKYVDAGNDVDTPKLVVTALNYNGGKFIL